MRDISGTLVKFEDGGRVAKVSLPSDFSSVIISGLSASSTAAKVSILLKDLGHDVSSDSIRLWPASGATSTSAHVIVEEPGSAKRICAQLNSFISSNSPYTLLTARQATPKLPASVSTKRISCKKVLVSWNKPVKLVWLNFGSSNIAERVCEKFNQPST